VFLSLLSLGSCEFGGQCHCSGLPEDTCLQSELFSVECDVKLSLVVMGRLSFVFTVVRSELALEFGFGLNHSFCQKRFFWCFVLSVIVDCWVARPCTVQSTCSYWPRVFVSNHDSITRVLRRSCDTLSNQLDAQYFYLRVDEIIYRWLAFL